MRNLIDLVSGVLTESTVSEAPARTRTKKPADQMSLEIDGQSSKGELTTARANTSVAGRAEPKLPGKTSTAAQTRASVHAATADFSRLGNDMRTVMNRVGDVQDEISDDEAARRAGFNGGVVDDGAISPPNPDNLPAVINTAIAETGLGLEPNWRKIGHLPGYMVNQFRAMGRQLFAPFTNTPIEEIQVVSTLSNSMPEVKALYTWIQRNGMKDDAAQIDFDDSPAADVASGLRASVEVWNVKDFTFFLVKDPHGYYVYGWPGGRGTQVSDNHYDAPRLR